MNQGDRPGASHAATCVAVNVSPAIASGSIRNAGISAADAVATCPRVTARQNPGSTAPRPAGAATVPAVNSVFIPSRVSISARSVALLKSSAMQPGGTLAWPRIAGKREKGACQFCEYARTCQWREVKIVDNQTELIMRVDAHISVADIGLGSISFGMARSKQRSGLEVTSLDNSAQALAAFAQAGMQGDNDASRRADDRQARRCLAAARQERLTALCHALPPISA